MIERLLVCETHARIRVILLACAPQGYYEKALNCLDLQKIQGKHV